MFEKTMLTYDTLTRFEKEFVTEKYTKDDIGIIEHSAYVANMNRCANREWTDADVFLDFLRVLDLHNIEFRFRRYEGRVKP